MATTNTCRITKVYNELNENWIHFSALDRKFVELDLLAKWIETDEIERKVSCKMDSIMSRSVFWHFIQLNSINKSWIFQFLFQHIQPSAKTKFLLLKHDTKLVYVSASHVLLSFINNAANDNIYILSHINTHHRMTLEDVCSWFHGSFAWNINCIPNTHSVLMIIYQFSNISVASCNMITSRRCHCCIIAHRTYDELCSHSQKFARDWNYKFNNLCMHK